MFEFDDTFAEIPNDTFVPENGDVFISVEDGRPIVSRCRYIDDGVWTCEHCSNWQELETLAAQAVAAAWRSPALAVNVYQCPARLRLRAVWPAMYEVIAPAS
jgi:hypothetical protein